MSLSEESLREWSSEASTQMRPASVTRIRGDYQLRLGELCTKKTIQCWVVTRERERPLLVAEVVSSSKANEDGGFFCWHGWGPCHIA